MTATRRLAALLGALAAWAAGGCEPQSSDLVLVGSVERTLVELVAPTSERILSLEVEPGQRVEPGQVAVRLDPTLALAELARAEAAVAGARTAAVVSGHDYARSIDLARRDVISSQQLDAASLARDEAAARLWAAEATVVAARKRVADHTLVAPVRAIVDQLPFETGERVPAGAVVAVLLDAASPWVRVWVPSYAFERVRPGSTAQVRVHGLSETLSGHVLDVAREPEFTPHYALTERDRAHLVYQARVRIDGAPALRPGAPADVVIHLAPPLAALEPSP